MEAQMIDPEPDAKSAMATVRDTRRARVLVAEDDDDMRRLIAAVLRQDGYDVVQAEDGLELLRFLNEESSEWADGFDAVVSDIEMPSLSALDVMDAIRSREVVTPIVLVTAYGDPRTRSAARALGARTVLDKPVHWPDLRKAVRQAVAAP